MEHFTRAKKILTLIQRILLNVSKLNDGCIHKEYSGYEREIMTPKEKDIENPVNIAFFQKEQCHLDRVFDINEIPFLFAIGIIIPI
jgi:hypothetical protein